MPRSLTRCHPVNHYCRSISRPQASENRPGSLQVTGTYLYDHSRTSRKPLSSSTQSAQPTPSQDIPWKETTISCHCNLRGENMEIEICAERGSARRMERDSRRIVRNDTFLFLYIAESPAVLYNHSHALQCLFMQRRPRRETSLLEGKRLSVNRNTVRLLLRIVTYTSC